LLKTNGRKLAKYLLDLRGGGEEGKGEERREVTWNEGGTEQADNCTFHLKKERKSATCPYDNYYSTLVAI
jgi:hypothetical protein